MNNAPLQSYILLFKYYKQLGDKAIAQVKQDEMLFWSPGAESNSIAIIIQHLYGNMKSRWTDFLSSDGEKEWRMRDQEFELYCDYRAELNKLWEEGWNCLFDALDTVNDDNKNQLVYIRNKGHNIDEAVQRQLGHYAYHIGQIVYLSRMIAADSWSSLSIPKGESKSYNKSAFAEGQRKEHFTDHLLDKDESSN